MADVLEVVILGTDKASPVFDSIGSNLGKAFKIGTGIAIGGLTALTTAIGLSIAEAMDAEQIQAKLNSVIKSTGGVAGVSAKEANRLAESLSKVTKFSDDTIVSTETMLLTFTKIGEGIFPQATEAALNMAEMFGSADQAAIQLGKALNDPIAGVTALRRVGVTLTEQQEDMIKHFVEVGDIASAQQVILKELETEFGGLARAAGNTLGGKLTILKNRFMDVFESVGMKLLPALNKLADRIMAKVMPAIEGLIPIFDSLLWPVVRFIENLAKGMSVGDAFKRMFADIGTTLQWFLDQLGIGSGTLSDIVASIIWPFQRFFEAAAGGTPLLENLAGLLVDFNDVFEFFLVKLGVAPEVADKVTDAIRPLLQQFDTFVGSIISFVKEHAEGFKAALIAIGGVLAGAAIVGGILAVGAAIASLFNPITLIIGGIGLLAMAWQEDWGGIRTYITDTVWPAIKPILQELKDWFEVNLPKAIIFIRDKWEQVLLPALHKLKDFWYDTLKPALDNLVSWFIQHIPDAIETLKGFWDDTLMPALQDLLDFWDFYLEPVLEDLVEFLEVKIGSAIDVLAPIIEDVLIVAFNDAKEAAEFLIGKLGSLSSTLSTAVTSAINTAKPLLDGFTIAIDAVTAALNALSGQGSSGSGVYNTATGAGAAGSGPMVQAKLGSGHNYNQNYSGPKSILRDSGGSGFPGQWYKLGVPEFFMPGTPGTFMPLEIFQKGIMAAVSDFNTAIARLDTTMTQAMQGAGAGSRSNQTVNHFNLNLSSNSSDERVRSDFDTMRVMAGA